MLEVELGMEKLLVPNFISNVSTAAYKSFLNTALPTELLRARQAESSLTVLTTT
jgi:hypothetical protein